jgi:hypothetical protein
VSRDGGAPESHGDGDTTRAKALKPRRKYALWVDPRQVEAYGAKQAERLARLKHETKALASSNALDLRIAASLIRETVDAIRDVCTAQETGDDTGDFARRRERAARHWMRLALDSRAEQSCALLGPPGGMPGRPPPPRSAWWWRGADAPGNEMANGSRGAIVIDLAAERARRRGDETP